MPLIQNLLWVLVSFEKCYKRIQKLYGWNSILYIFLSNLIFPELPNLHGLPPLF